MADQPQFAVEDDADPVGKAHCLGKIMGHERDRAGIATDTKSLIASTGLSKIS